MTDHGYRIAYICGIAGGVGTGLVVFLLLAAHYGIDPSHMTGPEVVDRLSTGSLLVLFGGSLFGGLFGMVLGSRLGPVAFGYHTYDRIDELAHADVEQIRRGGLTVRCPACKTPTTLVVQDRPPNLLAVPVATCPGSKGVLRARVQGSIRAF
jgi:hypothetical protein